MGLDGVELVIEAEETFGIKISDDEAAGVITVGDLYQLVARKTGRDRPIGVACLSATTYRLIRAALPPLADGTSRRVRPRDSLRQFMPDVASRQWWAALEASLGLDLPSLERPPWLNALIKISAPAASFMVAWSLLQAPIPLAAFVVGPLLWFVANRLLDQITQQFATRVPATCGTMGELTTAVMARNYGALNLRFQAPGSKPFWNESLWLEIVAVIATQLGVSAESITPRTTFAGDLGLD